MFWKVVKNSFLVYLTLGVFGLFIYSRFLIPKQFVVAGHDSGLPLDAREFLNSRLFAWEERIGFGVDNSHLFGSLTIHFIDYLSSWVVGVPHAGNWFNLFFWLSLIFLAAGIFAYQFKDIFGRYFVFIFPPLVIFNFYLFQSVFVLERAKYSVLVSILLFLAIIYKFQEKKISLWLAASLASLVFFVFNSGGLLGLPLYGSLIVIVGVYLIFSFVRALANRDFSGFLRLILFLALTAFGSLLLNSYQILPYLPGILGKSYVLHLSSKVLVKSKDWVDYISQNASFLNIFRLQGIPSWYSEINLADPSHAYAAKYSTNKFLVFVSFLFPFLSFLSLILTKKKTAKSLLVLFAAIALVSMLFVAGTHRPLGFIYGFLYDNFPPFSIFRTPYYKFAGAYFLSIAFLLGASVSIILDRLASFLKDKQFVGYGLVFLMIFSWLIYHRPLFAADNIFYWNKSLSTKIKIPSYVDKARQWLDSVSLTDGRVLLAPPIDEINFGDSYAWGYWSLSPITYPLTRAPVLSNEVAVTDEERGWVNLLYDLLRKKDGKGFVDLASRLGVGSVLFRGDVLESSSLSNYKEALSSIEEVSEAVSLDEWSFYKMEKGEDTLFSALTYAISVPQGHNYLSRSYAKDLGRSVSLGVEYDPTVEGLLSGQIQVYQCASCVLEKRPSLTGLPKVNVLPNSPLYFFKESRDKEVLDTTKDNKELIDSYLGISLRRLAEIKTMLDLSVAERDIFEALETINFYLDELDRVIRDSVDLKSDFVTAKRVADFLDPAYHELVGYVQGQEFTRTKEAKLREELFATLWRINTIKSYFSPLTEESDIWARQKFYSVDFPKSGDYSLYLQASSLAQKENGEPILPDSLEITKEGVRTKVDLESVENGWLKFDLDYQIGRPADLALYFDETPNLFKNQENVMRSFYGGPKACVVGRVDNIKNFKRYLIKIIPGVNISDLTLILRDPDRTYSRRHGFTRGEIEIEIPGGNPYRYIYHPSFETKNLEILICGRDEINFPNMSEVSVHEIFEPLVISVLSKEVSSLGAPRITYSKVNPTKYILNVSDSRGPFILVFNSRFSPLWRLEAVNEDIKGLSSLFSDISATILGTDPQKNRHFLVDGYANGWLISSDADLALSLEYIPQKLFYIGCIITLVFLLVILVGTLYEYKGKTY